MKKYYDVLGLNEGASKEEIEDKYKILSKEFDPKKRPTKNYILLLGKIHFLRIGPSAKILFQIVVCQPKTNGLPNIQTMLAHPWTLKLTFVGVNNASITMVKIGEINFSLVK